MNGGFFKSAYAALVCALLAMPLPFARADESRDGVWTSIETMPPAAASGEAWIRPNRFHAIRLDPAALTNALARVPRETAVIAGATNAHVIELPMPEGGFARFEIAEAPVMASALAKNFPMIRTYVGVGVDDPHASVRLDWTPAGFHAQVLSPSGAFYIDPYTKGDVELYTSYRRHNLAPPDHQFECLFTNDTERKKDDAPSVGLLRAGPTLRTYRAAIAASGEYSSYHGGTVTSVLAAIVTALNRVTGVYETELGIRIVLVAGNTNIIYLNRFTDPYTPAFPSLMLLQNQSTLDTRIGDANYDIGHVFSTGGGGLASLGCVCLTGLKAQGLTGSANPIGDPFWIDFVAHEMGHQFGANHTFNGTGGSCSGGNRNAPTAYEPGSGSTIMAYAGICGASDNIQTNSDPYFHFASFDEIIGFITTTGDTCAVASPTTNNAPTVSAGLPYTIPRLTPFALTATGSDPDGDPLTFCWEERDLGPAQTAADADNGTSPIIRSRPPSTSPTRIVPAPSNLLANTTALGEKLPTLPRAMKFRVTARDNRPGGGGVNTDDVTITVVTSAGPFLVTAPNSKVTWGGLSTTAWDRANTHLAPVNCQAVNIWLSTNGGFLFNIPLALNVTNSGSRLVWLPAIATTNARIKIEAADNIFFDVSNTNFTITAGVADTDVDEIPDAWEFFHFTNLTTAAAATDFDGDGVSDHEEYLADTNPKDANSFLRATAATTAPAGSGFLVRWTSATNRVYTLSRTTNFPGGFLPLATNIPAAPPENVFTDAAPPAATAIYQIETRAP